MMSVFFGRVKANQRQNFVPPGKFSRTDSGGGGNARKTRSIPAAFGKSSSTVTCPNVGGIGVLPTSKLQIELTIYRPF